MITRRNRRTRRTVRSATLVAVAAAAAFSLTACQSGDNDASGSQKKTSASTKVEAGSGKNQTDVRTKTASQVRTKTLADGSKAKIYKLGDQHYRAKIVSDGAVTATMETKPHDAGLNANGMFVTLTLGGQIHSWMGGDEQGPGTFDIEGGWKAKVTKVGENHFRAKIIGHDGVAATMDANQHDAGLDANGVPIVLSAGGVISAHE
ncbi:MULTISPECIES: hypothetical protein [unclassified Streptomyces]|uniref:hypothetical protein n=1 Tax=unclassified Streptomyces TaxID=2593676 RepID=UPI002DD9A1D6|nr:MULTISPECIES: hypothetical protein [unclassified Streptomyces]WSA92701.1 hypothetical protein OIE63_14860 [Streptomyces sp. NBC_01795]WSB77072.1 hypothetical protein OHB04_15695 [Streptomyces sp. NBC_01775]WSS14661.1 hypothetical protein OG533_24280 [Streptomyces sp. NBC_01186]WSS43475.1 hypothetical protein OG220_24950 [Streptomyces sp. NBC_01187]